MPASSLAPTERFSSRVTDYVRYRPSYPAAMLEWLHDTFAIEPDWTVADIGAGTGISSKLFLDAGHTVTAVEPNAAMRAASVEFLHHYPRFRAVEGDAENTRLDDAGTDLISVAQAFHWFDPQKVRSEWRRILSPRGLVAVYWNSRLLRGSPFLEAYECLLLEYGTDYSAVSERYHDDDSMRRWFGAGFRDTARFPNRQRLDFDALRGRLLSSSYAPQAGHPRHEAMLRALADLFERSAVDGNVDFDYQARIFVGMLD